MKQAEAMDTNSEAQSLRRRAGALGVHSVNRFVFSVPDIDEACAFYSAFGLDVRSSGNRLDLYAFGHPHCWVRSLRTANRRSSSM